MTKLLMTVFAMISLSTAAGSVVASQSSASLVGTDGLGGRVELSGAYMPAMADARSLMAARCDGRFEYVVVGEALEFRCTVLGAQSQPSGSELALATTGMGF